MSSTIKTTPLPSGRIGRALRLGRLAAGVAGGALGAGARQWLRGADPRAADLLLNPANAARISKQLAEMRGAAMKVGQLLSLEAGDWLPREATGILALLRDAAHAMPADALESTLARAWGSNWESAFRSFEREAFAAASIGQVHRALGRDGRRLAVKVQYPAIADSIDSDVDNVGRLLAWLRLLPPGIDLERLLGIARAQLHEEADYRLEAANLNEYRGLLGNQDDFCVPEVITSMSDHRVLVMTYLDGDSIDALALRPAGERRRLAARLIDLVLCECLHWGVVQSDPNFANFRYDAASGRIGLLDFGAVRRFSPGRRQAYARLARALLARDLAAVDAAAREVGYADGEASFTSRMLINELLMTAAEPAIAGAPFDFGHSDLLRRLGDRLYELRGRPEMQILPPPDVLFLHRKLAGVYLLCARLDVRIDVRARLEGALDAMPGAATAPSG